MIGCEHNEGGRQIVWNPALVGKKPSDEFKDGAAVILRCDCACPDLRLFTAPEKPVVSSSKDDRKTKKKGKR